MSVNAESLPTLADQETELRRQIEAAGVARDDAIRVAGAEFKKQTEAIKQRVQEALERIQRERRTATRQAEQERDDRSTRLEERLQNEYLALERQYQQVADRITARYNSEKSAAKRQMKEANWESQTVFDATKHRPLQELQEVEKLVAVKADRLEAIATDAQEYLRECQLAREPRVDPEAPLSDEIDPLQRFNDTLPTAEAMLAGLKQLLLPRLFRSGMPFWLLVVLWLALAYPFGVRVDWHYSFAWQSGLTALAIDIFVNVWLYIFARRHVAGAFDPLCQLLMDAERSRVAWHEAATAKCQRETAAIQQKFRNDVHASKVRYDELRAKASEVRNTDAQEAEAKYAPQLRNFKQFHAHESQDLVKSFDRRSAEISAGFEETDRVARQSFEVETQQAEINHKQAVAAAMTAWQDALGAVGRMAAEINDESDVVFPPWVTEAWERWTPPRSIAPVIRFGKYTVPLLESAPAASPLPIDTDSSKRDPIDTPPRLKLPGFNPAGNGQHGRHKIPAQVDLPAFLEFPDRCSLLIRASGTGRLKAVDALQAVMLRYLTVVPPGKVRFTIIDPVGLGQNFAGFMHLADYDELLVTHKIWTEPAQIEQRLADLSAHMANVIQKYLRNEFATIDDYNKYAGEVAEPYRVLVVANFPFNFTETAARHLVSIATTGARCGVYTLVSIDTRLPIPYGFRGADLEQSCVKLAWRDGAFVWRDDAYEQYPLVVDGPPKPELFSKIVHDVGEAAKDSNRVEVPFDFIAPPPDKWWTSSTASGVDVPLGRAGATKKQNLTLGRGTSQHVLIAGKTGSGKSTMMHALIVNTALMYSPDEVELYLIDFKKGVEFKTYAQYHLPHARVIAIESEREFGLSVLQRLDLELKNRGELFRDLNVQDLPSYRESTGKSMPRILLVIDEFQEFFVEDDKIAQDVSLLMDRLVRQGRAFGIHVHLGSQTLGGSYSLPRATLGQMAVRVALQCSEADANLILSEENPAARLLTRPGEAIYNDANGRSEGNHLFQVVWLSEERREDYLRKLSDMAVARNLNNGSQIVFEGNVPADITRNTLLRDVIQQPRWPDRTLAATTWLGEAIAIKDPTAAVFRPQTGNHLALIGQQGEGSLAMMMTMIVSLAAQYSPGSEEPNAMGPRFIVLDGQPPDAQHAGMFNKLKNVLPHQLQILSPRDTAKAIDQVATEVERRQALRESDLPPIFLFIYDLQRFRDLRKADDDFGFGRDAKPSPSKQLVSILKDGPSVSVHVIVWADSLNNMQRSFDRQAMREFESRVLFQMSVTDSSSLIDSPLASKLGPHRAMMHSEAEGRLEKFRPYSLPTDAWLAEVAKSFNDRPRGRVWDAQEPPVNADTSA